MARAIDGFGDFERLRGRARAGAVVADVEIHQHVDFAAGVLIPLDLLDVIDHHHGSGGGDARDFRGVGHGRGQQQPGDAAFRHQLRLRERGHAHAAGSGGELALGDLDALVGLGVGAQGFAGAFHLLHHAREVGFEGVQIEQQGRGEDFSFEQASIVYSVC